MPKEQADAQRLHHIMRVMFFMNRLMRERMLSAAFPLLNAKTQIIVRAAHVEKQLEQSCTGGDESSDTLPTCKYWLWADVALRLLYDGHTDQ